jgi:hypothetical protein
LLRRVRSGLPILLAVLGSSGLFPATASASFSVGNFTKSTSAAPVTQNVAHGLGETPKAIIVWTDGKTSATLNADYRFGLGFSDVRPTRPSRPRVRTTPTRRVEAGASPTR